MWSTAQNNDTDSFDVDFVVDDEDGQYSNRFSRRSSTGAGGTHTGLHSPHISFTEGHNTNTNTNLYPNSATSAASISNPDINDVRSEKDFRGISFTGYKKLDVKKQFMSALYNCNLESACYWGAELLCAGHFVDVWEVYTTYFFTHVHAAAPEYAIYLNQRMVDFLGIFKREYEYMKLSMRNDKKVRRLFAEVACILSSAKKQHAYTRVKVREGDFDMDVMTTKLRAPSAEYITGIFEEEDPQSLFIPLNEFAYCVSSEVMDGIHACYWLEWVLEYENRSRVRVGKGTCECSRRLFIIHSVDNKYQKEVVWIVWQILLKMVSGREYPAILHRVVHSVFEMFCWKYTTGLLRRRKDYLYFVINLLTNATMIHALCTKKIKFVHDGEKLAQVTGNVGVVYDQIKEAEVNRGMVDYYAIQSGGISATGGSGVEEYDEYA